MTDKGDHSRNNESEDSEKPFKKARYVWEIKGKHHLKNSANTPSCSKSPVTDDEAVQKPGSSLEKPRSTRHKCCIDSFLNRTEEIMNRSLYPDDIPPSLVADEEKNEDYYLRKWQARQIARGFVDNTINLLLENWNNPPFDPSDFVDSCASAGMVEDDAILMAIQSHGLQNTSRYRLGFATNNLSTLHDIARPSINDSTISNFENYNREVEREESVASASSSDSLSVEANLDTNSTNSSNTYDDFIMGDPADFLNAAVSAAILEKGLSCT